MIKIRPHHLLCIPRFIGEGYSDDFIDSFGEIKKQMESGEIIRLTEGCDDICMKCPENRNFDTHCQSGAKPKFHMINVKLGENMNNTCDQDWVAELDKKVIGLLGIEYGDEISGDVILADSREKVPTVKDICLECQWQELCIRVESMV